MRKKSKTTAPIGGAYTQLPDVTANRGIDLQMFVDSYVDCGNGKEAYFASGGEGSDSKAIQAAYALLKKPEVQQAITERSAQKFFELAPKSVSVLKDILDNPSLDPKMVQIKAKVAMEVMAKIQIEKHNDQRMKDQANRLKVGSQMAEIMTALHEFVRKNPERDGYRAGITINPDGSPVLEEHQPD